MAQASPIFRGSAAEGGAFENSRTATISRFGYSVDTCKKSKLRLRYTNRYMLFGMACRLGHRTVEEAGGKSQLSRFSAFGNY